MDDKEFKILCRELKKQAKNGKITINIWKLMQIYNKIRNDRAKKSNLYNHILNTKIKNKYSGHESFNGVDKHNETICDLFNRIFYIKDKLKFLRNDYRKSYIYKSFSENYKCELDCLSEILNIERKSNKQKNIDYIETQYFILLNRQRYLLKAKEHDELREKYNKLKGFADGIHTILKGDY